MARALAADPPVLLMDEPFGALDPVTRAEMHREFRRIQEQVRKTVVLVTHDMAEAFALAARVGVLADGVLAALDTPAAIARSQDPRVRPLLEPLLEATRRSRRSAVPATAAPDDAAGTSGGRTRPSSRRSSASTCCWSAISTLVAIAAGVPIGILAARRPRAGAPIVWLANVVQTIPSLAMFGFLLPLPLVGGLGARVAIFVLILYALLPIVRTTAAGLRSVDRVLVEAGTAMGMTPWQLLRDVELPLALPSIVAGIRVAAVIGVGTATIAAAVGAGGLGEYIFRGLSMVDPTVILAGAIPSAVLALTIDGALTALERVLKTRQRRQPAPRAGVAAGPGRAAGRGRADRGVRAEGWHERHPRRVEELHRADHPRRADRAGDRGATGCGSSAA